MSRISSPINQIKDHYAVVIVGSGYGGGISASRLARAGQSVCLLERGKEFQPGEYPDTELETLAELQTDFPHAHEGSRTGLYDFRVNDDVNVFLGCGLGGTSLVNANVVLRAEPRVFDDPCWPQAVRDDLNTLVEDGYRHALEMLRPAPLPESIKLRKLEALEKSAAELKEKFYRPPLNVTFEEPPNGINHVGVEQHACKLCGDCVTGCNYHAKNTVLMNYLPDARNHGAEIYTQVSVRHLERANERWVVHYQLLDSGREKFDAPTMFVSADIVILAAGTLGSTEILLRSKANGLSLSDRQLGKHFTGNGDVLAFGYNNDVEINGVGFGALRPEGLRDVGPTITGIIDAREKPDLDSGIVIEEGAVPSGLGPTLPAGLAAAAAGVGVDTDSGLVDFVSEKKRELESLVRGPYHGAAHNTQTYLIMTHDDSDGEMSLEDDRLRIHWSGVGAKPIFQVANDKLKLATRPLGGTYVEDPIWSKLLKRELITVHPLGGCSMAESAERGVVNHKGQVFNSNQGTDVHPDLYVSDGSVMPRSLGVNPLFTISAMAERCCALIARDHGWEIDYEFHAPPPPSPLERIGVQFTERMHGWFSTEVKDDYQAAAKQGEAAGSTLEFTLTIASDDLEKAISDPAHEFRMAGSVTADALSARPLTVTEGVFNLFTIDPEHVDTTNMRYRMKLSSEERKVYYFEGFKVVHNDPGADAWPDTTTLYTTVYEGTDANGPIVGRGILRISPDDFMRQLTTMQVTNAPSLKERLDAQMRFGRYFAGVLYETYGGIFAKPNVFNPDAPPRKKRPLRITSAPEVHTFSTSDGVQLRLTRYQGGSKGPVILSHGLGVSSLIFSIDTIGTNLVEYLFAHGFDVWALDYRASIDLPASLTQFSGDDIATKDYPAAVAKVKEITGAGSVQMVAHCFGSTTFFMAMLAGLQGVRSAVCSQIATNIVAPVMTRIKCGLHMPSLMDDLGIDSLNAYVDTHAKWYEKLYDKALNLYPMEAEERCNNATCHRITFMYSNLYEHDQLNTATHEALHEMFGIANVTSFEHLALLVRKGHLVGADGGEAYMPHLERLAIPIAFIHGAENQCFLPESTRLTFNLLREKNGSNLYSRHVIPGYGHIDCIYGKDAASDVYPFMLQHLEGPGV
jgi:cholesterol oxidase